MNKYKLFLENINLIDKKYQILKSKDENFNIFSILRNEYDEVNLHSKFIVELIKNKTYGYKFLILFLKKIGIDFFEIKDYQVFGEYTVKNNGRIDILIKIYSKIEKKVIVLENKIYAEDQFQQLKRYYDSMVREGYKDKEIEIVYLTLFGQAPSEESILGLKGKNIIEISYKNEIIEWIEELIKEVAQNPIMRETLVQYKNLLEKLTNSEEKDFMKELKEMILLNQEYLNIAWKLPDIVESIKVDLQLKFWQKLEEKLDVSLKEKGFLKENSLPFPNHHYSKENIETYLKLQELFLNNISILEYCLDTYNSDDEYIFDKEKEVLSLSTRSIGASFKRKVVNLIEMQNPDYITFDFDGIDSTMSSSFADEVFGKIIEEKGRKFLSKIRIKNLSEVNKNLIQRAIAQRLELQASY